VFIPKNRRRKVARARRRKGPKPPPGATKTWQPTAPGFPKPPQGPQGPQAPGPRPPGGRARRRLVARPGFKEGRPWPMRKLLARQIAGNAPILHEPEEG